MQLTVTEDLIREILGRFVTRSLQESLRGTPLTEADFLTLVEKSERVKILYRDATRLKAEFIALETVDISDTEIDPARARNRIAARQWLASKLNSQRFSERVQLDQTTVDLTEVLKLARERRERVLQPCFESNKPVSYIPENKALISQDATDRPSVATLDELF